MVKDKIDRLLELRENQRIFRETEPRVIRLEPRQILSVARIQGGENIYAKIKDKFFKGLEIFISEDEDDTVNRIEYEIPSPHWAGEYICLFWVRWKTGRHCCVRVVLNREFSYLEAISQDYIRIHYKSGDDLFIYPENRSKYLSLCNSIDEMITTDKPIWIKV